MMICDNSPTRIFLVRHGATDLTTDDRFAGSSDVALNAAGVRQADALAERLRGESLDAAYASPMARTMETARRIARPHGLVPLPASGLREIDYGVWETRPRSQVEAIYAGDYSFWMDDPFARAPQNGETGQAVLRRSLPELRRIVDRHRGRQVLVVAHKGTNRLLISQLLGHDPRSYRQRLDQSPGALNVLEFAADGAVRVSLLNDVSHIPCKVGMTEVAAAGACPATRLVPVAAAS